MKSASKKRSLPDFNDVILPLPVDGDGKYNGFIVPRTPKNNAFSARTPNSVELNRKEELPGIFVDGDMCHDGFDDYFSRLG
jgi:hypothetical protein